MTWFGNQRICWPSHSPLLCRIRPSLLSSVSSVRRQAAAGQSCDAGTSCRGFDSSAWNHTWVTRLVFFMLWKHKSITCSFAGLSKYIRLILLLLHFSTDNKSLEHKSQMWWVMWMSAPKRHQWVFLSVFLLHSSSSGHGTTSVTASSWYLCTSVTLFYFQANVTEQNESNHGVNG